MIELITESGYRLTVSKNFTEVEKDGKRKKFIGNDHRTKAVIYVLGEG